MTRPGSFSASARNSSQVLMTAPPEDWPVDGRRPISRGPEPPTSSTAHPTVVQFAAGPGPAGRGTPAVSVARSSIHLDADLLSNFRHGRVQVWPSAIGSATRHVAVLSLAAELVPDQPSLFPIHGVGGEGDPTAMQFHVLQDVVDLRRQSVAHAITISFARFTASFTMTDRSRYARLKRFSSERDRLAQLRYSTLACTRP